MELIVNESNFSDTFKKALGFPDADMSFERLLPTLEIASDEIIDLITEDNYAKLITYTKAENFDISESDVPAVPVEKETNTFPDLSNSKKFEFLRLVRYAMLSKAFNMYVGLGDLAVTNNGRTMRRDDHQVSAFNWQIEKHDSELEQLYYRHLDRLIRFMIKHKLEINQEKYNHKDLIVNSLSQFEKFIDVKGSYALYIRLIPGLREAEKQIILPRLGKDLYNALKDETHKDLAFLVQKTIVYHALIWGFYKLELQVFPKGMLSHNSVYAVVNSRNTAETRMLRQTLALNFEKDLERDLISLEKMVAEINKPTGIMNNTEIEMPDFGFGCDDGFVNT